MYLFLFFFFKFFICQTFLVSFMFAKKRVKININVLVTRYSPRSTRRLRLLVALLLHFVFLSGYATSLHTPVSSSQPVFATNRSSRFVFTMHTHSACRISVSTTVLYRTQFEGFEPDLNDRFFVASEMFVEYSARARKERKGKASSMKPQHFHCWTTARLCELWLRNLLPECTLVRKATYYETYTL